MEGLTPVGVMFIRFMKGLSPARVGTVKHAQGQCSMPPPPPSYTDHQSAVQTSAC